MIDLIKLFSTPLLDVEWDNVVQGYLKQPYNQQNHARIPIQLLDLLILLGSVQPKRRKQTKISSLLDYGSLLGHIDDTVDFRLRISSIRNYLGSEELKGVTELLGCGLSASVLSHLFDIERSTIHKIIDVSSTRPDWRCFLKDNRILLVESKGSTSQYTSTQQLKKAVNQKSAMTGDVKVATGSVLNETFASKMRIIDPPTVNEGNRNSNRRHIYRAFHYSSLFSSLGDDVLFLYFEKMAKRLSGRISEEEMEDKERMYIALNRPSIISFNGIEYSGHVYGPVDNRYLLIGVDKRLLSFQGFMDYQDAETDYQKVIEGNRFLIQSDGVLIGNILNPDAFFRDNQIESIGIGPESIALSDLNSIHGYTFKRYVKYLLNKCDETAHFNERGSIIATINGQEKEFHIYHVHNAPQKASQRRINKLLEYMANRQGTLVTNLFLPDSFELPYIDKIDFERIAESDADREIVRDIFGRK